MPLRQMWNTTSPFLQNELFRAVSTSASNAFLLLGHKTELELIEGLRFIETFSFEPTVTTADTYTARPKNEIRKEVNPKTRKFSRAWNKEQVTVRSAGELEAHRPPEFQLLNFSVVGNGTVSANQELAFSYSYLEGPSAATLELYVSLGVCEDSSQKKCQCSAVSIWLTSILISGSRTAGNETSCMATTTVGEDWMAGFYRVEFLYVPPINNIPADYYQSVGFEKQDGFAFKTYLPPTLLNVEFIGNVSVVPGDVIKFKMSIAKGTFPVICSSLYIYFRSEFTHFWFQNIADGGDPESSATNALECTKTITLDVEVPRGNYSIPWVSLRDVFSATLYSADGSVYDSCGMLQSLNTTAFKSNPYFYIDVPESRPAQLQDFKMLNDVLITRNSTIKINVTITEGSFALRYIIAYFTNERGGYLYFGGYVSDQGFKISVQTNSSNTTFELSTPVLPHWTDGNYSFNAVHIEYGNYHMVSYYRGGEVYYNPPSELGKHTHTLFRDEIFFELVQDFDQYFKRMQPVNRNPQITAKLPDLSQCYIPDLAWEVSAHVDPL